MKNAKFQQRGVSLIFSLLALVALALGAVALVRSIDSGVMAMGNLAFKQSSLLAGARAVDTAQAWLEANVAGDTLDGDLPDKGYYATSLDNLDVTGQSVSSASVLALVDWDANGCKVNGQTPATPRCVKPSAAITVGSDSVNYIITRLCSQALPFSAATNNCASSVVSGTTAGQGRGAVDYATSEHTGTPTMNPYFRVVTRTLGPKGTVSFTETLIDF